MVGMSCSEPKNLWLFWATRGTPKPNLVKKWHNSFFAVFQPNACFWWALRSWSGLGWTLADWKNSFAGASWTCMPSTLIMILWTSSMFSGPKDTYFREMAGFPLKKNKHFSNSFFCFWTWAHETHQCCRPIGPSKLPDWVGICLSMKILGNWVFCEGGFFPDFLHQLLSPKKRISNFFRPPIAE